MSTILFKRGTTTEMNNTPITDGMLYFCTSDYKIYMDNGNTRYQYGGDTDLISSVSSASASNAFNASASLNLFLQKTTVVDTKANALAVTQNRIPLGCLAFKEALGTTNYSGVGDGTISGGLVSLRGETLQGTLPAGNTTITLTSTIVNANSYIDIYTDTYKAVPNNVTVNNTSKQITITFPSQSANVVVKVIVRNM